MGCVYLLERVRTLLGRWAAAAASSTVALVGGCSAAEASFISSCLMLCCSWSRSSVNLSFSERKISSSDSPLYRRNTGSENVPKIIINNTKLADLGFLEGGVTLGTRASEAGVH